MAGYLNFVDQEGTEIYDNYDRRHHEGPVPQMLLDAIEGTPEDFDTVKVNIDYPFDGIWTLEKASLGRASWYAELGKKAFVHGGFYEHPVKEYTVTIEMMEPWDYIDWCTDIFNRRGDMLTPDELIEQRASDYDLDAIFGQPGARIFYPVIETRGGQEGLHRAVWAMQNDIPEIPVIVIKHD